PVDRQPGRRIAGASGNPAAGRSARGGMRRPAWPARRSGRYTYCRFPASAPPARSARRHTHPRHAGRWKGVKVLITIDTEISPIEIAPPAVLSRNIERRIWGRAGRSEVGIAWQARSLQEAGLTGVFFIESLCASVIDSAYLREWVAAVQQHGQEVQLHVHAEWAQYLGIAPQAGADGFNLFQYRRDD